MKELIIFLSLISLLSISSALPHFTFNAIESFRDCSGEKGKVSFYIIGSLSEEIGTVTLPNYNIKKMGDCQCALSKNEGEKDPARSHVITCTFEGKFHPRFYILKEPKVIGFDFLNEKGESTWPTDPEKVTFLIGECGERVQLDKETLFSGNTEKSGLFASGPNQDPVKTIRKDVVYEALKSLPERTKSTEMFMMASMQMAKIDFSLSDFEAAYMVYKWEYQNLKYDCYKVNHKLLDDIDYSENGTYTSGIGVCDGFSRLFRRFCHAMNIEAWQVIGYSKDFDYVPGVIYDDNYHGWNAIKIDGNYYLLDVTWGIGSCDGDDYTPKLTDSYFCTKPEVFIRTHHPLQKEYQLVYPTITLEEFFNSLYVTMEFYENGMTEINPDLPRLQIDDGKIKVEITYELPDDTLILIPHLYYLKNNGDEEKEYENKKACWIDEEKTRALLICHVKSKGDYKLKIFGGKNSKEKYPYLLMYRINSTKDASDLPDFPIAYPKFFRLDSQLIEPLYDPLPRGEFVNFKVRSAKAERFFVISGPVKVELENDGNGLYTGEIYIAGRATYLYDSEKALSILDYSTVLSPKVDVEPTYPKMVGNAPRHVLYSPLLDTLKIGKTYEFKIKCKKCLKLIVKDDIYYTELTKNGDMYTGTVNITGKGGDVKISHKIFSRQFFVYSYGVSK